MARVQRRLGVAQEGILSIYRILQHQDLPYVRAAGPVLDNV